MLLSQLACALLAVGARAANDSDLVWRDNPRAWHQQIARIVDHRFTTLAELRHFALNAKKAGVSALMLIEIQKTAACPGPWYNGLQLCDHINGSYPAPDGTLAQWRAMLREIAPMRLMWWTNPTYWSVQGQVWEVARTQKNSDVGRWFSWGPESCAGVPPCMGRNVVVPSVGCAQGSWGSEGMTTGVKSAMASFGSPTYESYLVDAFANSWGRNLGIDGFTIDVSANYPCATPRLLLACSLCPRALTCFGPCMRAGACCSYTRLMTRCRPGAPSPDRSVHCSRRLCSRARGTAHGQK